jgi:hypothetical protein
MEAQEGLFIIDSIKLITKNKILVIDDFEKYAAGFYQQKMPGDSCEWIISPANNNTFAGLYLYSNSNANKNLWTYYHYNNNIERVRP